MLRKFVPLPKGILIDSLVAIALIALPVHAVEVQNVLNPRQAGGWVTDMSNILSPQTEAQLNQMIAELEQKNGSEIAIVTVPNTSPYASPKEFTTILFNYWGVGKKGVDNGVVLMVSVGDRRVEIETGYGVEEILPDAKVGNIIDQKITPKFKQSDFDQGVLDGTKALILELSPAQFPLEKFIGRHQTQFFWLGGLGLFIVGLSKFFNRRRYIKPEGKTHVASGWSRPVYCQQCRQPMEKLESTAVVAQLNEAERFAHEHDYVAFTGWQCSTCKSTEPQNFHILFQVIKDHCTQCPQCSGWTLLSSTETVREPTYTATGLKKLSKTCAYCKHHEEQEVVLAVLVDSSLSSSASSSSWSGGGDFGGGDSGGGGAGGDW